MTRNLHWLFASGVILAACSDTAGTGPVTVSFTIAASHERITTPGRITFTAESAKPLARVEIYEGARKVGESVGTLDSDRAEIAVTSADNGAHTYVAKGYDASGNNVGQSEPVTVEVDIRWDLVRALEGVQGAARLAATDAGGGLYLLGTSQTTSDVSFDFDAYLTKYDADGNRLWIRTFASPAFETGGSAWLDPFDRVYFSGQTFDRGAPAWDGFLIVYDALGSTIRIERGRERFGTGVAATDASGSYYQARNFTDAVISVGKYDRDGNTLWTREFGSAPGTLCLVQSIAADPFGGVYVGGYTTGSVNGTPNRGGHDVVVVKFDADGNKLWASQYGTTDSDFARSLAADPDGGVYVAGERDHPDAEYRANHGWPYSDAMIARYASDGTLLWVRHLDGGHSDGVPYGSAVAVDRSAVYLVGGTRASTTSRGDLSEVRQGEADAFLAKLSREGALLSVRLLGGPGGDGATGVALGRNGDVYVSLYTAGGLPGVPNPGSVLARHREATP
jgi:hypothetical protein